MNDDRGVQFERAARHGRMFLISLAVWMVLCMPIIFVAYQNNLALGRSPNPLGFVIHPILRYTILALLTLPVFALTERFRVRRTGLAVAAGVHLLGFAAFNAVFAALRYLTLLVFPLGPVTYWGLMRDLLQQRLIEQFWAYAGILTAAHAVFYYREAKTRELAAATLEARVVRQQLQILKLQLHPHFVFNALHGISALMEVDVERARSAIARFSDLLRTALEQTDRDEVTVREECDFIDAYLTLESLRLGDRLAWSLVAGSEVMDAIVPSMVLQPLVENAIRHGIERRRDGGTLEIRIEREGTSLHLTVANDAPAAEHRLVRPGGVGLSNTRSRLESLYGDAQRVEFRRPETGRVEVAITIPLRKSGDLRSTA